MQRKHRPPLVPTTEKNRHIGASLPHQNNPKGVRKVDGVYRVPARRLSCRRGSDIILQQRASLLQFPPFLRSVLHSVSAQLHTGRPSPRHSPGTNTPRYTIVVVVVDRL